MMAGTVTRVMTELNAVSDTDSATSPLASMEKMLLDEPPGQQATSMTPMNSSGGRPSIVARQYAASGSNMSWPRSPTEIA